MSIRTRPAEYFIQCDRCSFEVSATGLPIGWINLIERCEDVESIINHLCPSCEQALTEFMRLER